MIESFTIKNYMSYRDTTELSFVASKKEGSKAKDLPPTWYKEINGKRILRLLFMCWFKRYWKIKDVFRTKIFANDCYSKTSKTI